MFQMRKFLEACVITALFFCSAVQVQSNENSVTEWRVSLGRSTWHFLHTTVAKFPDTPTAEEKQALITTIGSLELLYPCEICRIHLKENLKTLPSIVENVESRTAASLWLCNLHNVVNGKLHKPLFDCNISTLDEHYISNCGSCGSRSAAAAGAPAPASVVHTSEIPEAFPAGGLFVPIDAGRNSPQVGSCDLSSHGINEWIQGGSSDGITKNVTLTTGAATVIFFMSQSCHVCHDVAPKLNKLYKKFRDRGLNVIAVHATPKGYRSSVEEREGLRNFIAEEKLEFAFVDMHAKSGVQPTLADGSPDWDTAGRSKTLKKSLYRKVFGDMEYFVPVATLWKNCKPLIDQPVSGYDVMGIYDTIEQNADQLLWRPEDIQKRRKRKKAVIQPEL